MSRSGDRSGDRLFVAESDRYEGVRCSWSRSVGSRSADTLGPEQLMSDHSPLPPTLKLGKTHSLALGQRHRIGAK
jgi:hypothetical protein